MSKPVLMPGDVVRYKDFHLSHRDPNKSILWSQGLAMVVKEWSGTDEWEDIYVLPFTDGMLQPAMPSRFTAKFNEIEPVGRMLPTIQMFLNISGSTSLGEVIEFELRGQYGDMGVGQRFFATEQIGARQQISNFELEQQDSASYREAIAQQIARNWAYTAAQAMVPRIMEEMERREYLWKGAGK